MALARTLRGKISPVMTQAMGPQVEAKPAMYKHTRATRAFWPAVFWTEMVTPMIATRNSHMHIQAAPQMRRVRRPNFSTPHIPGMVVKTLTMLVATEMRKGSSIPEFWKNEVPSARRQALVSCESWRIKIAMTYSRR